MHKSPTCSSAALLLPCSFALLLLLASPLSAQNKADDEADPASIYAGLAIRDIGPAVTSGRITDFAMHPDGWQVYYAATASGGLWKTVNGGITFAPIFDNEGSYSIGVVELDPNNPDTVWVGSGENNAQRSVAYGDGVYKSLDGGRSWSNMGLETSEHIGSIVIDPRDSDVVYVAAQGPLWSAGGERGVYKTTDAGDNWEQVLVIDEYTGANELLMHPDSPDLLLASSWQRHRQVWTLIDGGPGSGVHRSTDFGVSWEKRSGYVAGSPQYYNELIVDPHNPDRLYSMDTFMQVSEDGGKSWSMVGIEHKHVDEHALWIDPANTGHLIAGNDGGIYESWDRGQNWRHVRNLPITQFYRATPDNDLPFYNVYGGTQDNSSLGAPSRTTFSYGIANHDWVITLGGDGFKTQVDPENPDTVYSQLQYGMLARFDRSSFERVLITPMPGADEDNYKWNWNSAFIISPHDRKRLYFAAEKLFRSDDGGNTWRVVSPDLTRQLDRNALEVMGRVWSVDAIAKNASTSMYGSIIGLSESPLQEGLLYVGTDDGLIQVSDDNGANWQRIENFGKVPEMTYVSDVEASLHDADTVYATFDNHKRGDYRPYVYVSNNRGRSWKSISGNLPERGSAHTIVQDHVDPELLFVGTEFGVFASQNGGQSWFELNGNMPTIAVRDLEIQRRESDLVIASFGRGIRILDDYSALRTPAAQLQEAAATLFSVRDAWLYAEDDVWVYGDKGSQGVTYFTADNPPFGAVFSYHLRDGYQSLREQRQQEENERKKGGDDNPYPSWDALRDEDREQAPELWFEISNTDGEVIRRITGSTGKGLHRTNWDLRLPAPDPVNLSAPGFRAPWASEPSGVLAAPGEYSVQMVKVVRGERSEIGAPQSFIVKPLQRGQFRPDSLTDHNRSMQAAADLSRAVQGAGKALGELQARIKHLRVALRDTPALDTELTEQLQQIDGRLQNVNMLLNGDAVKARASEPRPMGLAARVGMFSWAHWNALAAITGNQQQSLDIARTQFEQVQRGLDAADEQLQALEAAVAGEAPWTPGRIPVLED